MTAKWTNLFDNAEDKQMVVNNASAKLRKEDASRKYINNNKDFRVRFPMRKRMVVLECYQEGKDTGPSCFFPNNEEQKKEVGND